MEAENNSNEDEEVIDPITIAVNANIVNTILRF